MPSRRRYDERRRYERAEMARKAGSGMKTDYGAPKQSTTPYGAEEDTQASRRAARAGYMFERSKRKMRKGKRY